MTIERRELGKTGEMVSAIGVGSWAVGGTNWGGADDKKSAEGFHRALDLGINFIDTAPAYGFGRAERVLGTVLQGHRDEAFVATKFGLVWETEQIASINNDLRPESIRHECDASLKRLGIECIDLYQAHWPMQGDAMTRTVAEDMMATLNGLLDAGKVRYFGVSNFSIEQIDWCGGKATLASIQPPLSILRPGSAQELIPYCRDHGIGVVCYSPLFRGLLTGKYQGDETFPEGDSRAEHPDYSGPAFKGICRIARELERFADVHASTIMGVSLNWVLSTPGVTVAIAGMRSADQIRPALAGQGWSLSSEERDEIAEMFSEYSKIF